MTSLSTALAFCGVPAIIVIASILGTVLALLAARYADKEYPDWRIK